MTGTRLEGLHALPSARDLLSPWHVRNISVYPLGAGWWPFNPSIHRDSRDGTWRCLVRLANYTLPGGIPHLSSDARAGRAQTRNVLLALDEDTLAPATLVELEEPDGLPRTPSCTSAGLEDLRLFCTQADGLLAVGCALQYNLPHPNRPEIVLCRIEDARAHPRHRSGSATPAVRVDSLEILRGPWGFRPQKNWVPFDDTADVRLLYSIERGVVMAGSRPLPGSPLPVLPRVPLPASRQMLPTGRNSAEVRMFGRSVTAVTPAPATIGTGRHDELRGGSQLVALPDGRWLGLAHEMTFSVAGRSKFYWHTFYTVSQAGQLLECSPPLRLSGDHGIEFAAGLAIDPAGRLAVSYGTDDHEAWIATTTTSAVLELLQPTDRNRAETVEVAEGSQRPDA